MRSLAAALMVLAACGSPPERRRGVSYDERFGAETTLDVFLPARSGAPGPAVLLIHGGGWTSGEKSQYAPTAERLARSGYVAATIDYRLAPKHPYPAAIQDSFCALSFLRSRAEEYGLDPGRVAAVGYSAGGHLVSLLGVSAGVAEVAPDCAAGPTGPPDAVLSGAGVHDLRMLPDVAVTRDFLGGTAAELPERYATASPIVHVRAGAPPFLLVTGTADWFVDARQSERMRDALLAAGNEAALLTLSGGGHLLNGTANLGEVALDTSTQTPEGWAAMIDFLHRTVGAPEAR